MALSLVVGLVLPATAGANDFLLFLDKRAGPYRYLDSFKSGKPGAYESALAAFGQPTRFRTDGNLCRVTWGDDGITVGFASQLNPCAAKNLYIAAWYGLTLFGAQWRTVNGVRVGQSVAQVRRLYPKARFEQVRGQAWLVLAHLRDQELNFIRLAVVVNRAGRVASIEVPATYIY